MLIDPKWPHFWLLNRNKMIAVHTQKKITAHRFFFIRRPLSLSEDATEVCRRNYSGRNQFLIFFAVASKKLFTLAVTRSTFTRFGPVDCRDTAPVTSVDLALSRVPSIDASQLKVKLSQQLPQIQISVDRKI